MLVTKCIGIPYGGVNRDQEMLIGQIGGYSNIPRIAITA